MHEDIFVRNKDRTPQKILKNSQKKLIRAKKRSSDFVTEWREVSGSEDPPIA